MFFRRSPRTRSLWTETSRTETQVVFHNIRFLKDIKILSKLNLQSTTESFVDWFLKIWEKTVACVWTAPHSNTQSTNDVREGRGYMFGWPIADRGCVHITWFIVERLYNSATTKGQNEAISHEKLTFSIPQKPNQDFWKVHNRIPLTNYPFGIFIFKVLYGSIPEICWFQCDSMSK